MGAHATRPISNIQYIANINKRYQDFGTSGFTDYMMFNYYKILKPLPYKKYNLLFLVKFAF